MTGEEEPITEESIAIEESGYKELISKAKELSTLFDDLVKVNSQIERINQKIQGQLFLPMRPGTLDLHSQYEQGWLRYFEESKHYIQKKKEQQQLKEELSPLEAERTQIESKIRALVPPEFYNVQLALGNTQRRLTVHAETIKVI